MGGLSRPDDGGQLLPCNLPQANSQTRQGDLGALAQFLTVLEHTSAICTPHEFGSPCWRAVRPLLSGLGCLTDEESLLGAGLLLAHTTGRRPSARHSGTPLPKNVDRTLFPCGAHLPIRWSNSGPVESWAVRLVARTPPSRGIHRPEGTRGPRGDTTSGPIRRQDIRRLGPPPANLPECGRSGPWPNSRPADRSFATLPVIGSRGHFPFPTQFTPRETKTGKNSPASSER